MTMRRGPDGATWRTSFPLSLPAGTSDIVDATSSVLTVLSGSSGTGGHASMFLEHIQAGLPRTELIDLTMGPAGISISRSPAQIVQANGTVINMSLPKGGDWAELTRTRHHSYVLQSYQKDGFNAAVARFKTKVEQGRYVYRAPGGVLGYVSSAPGTRGVNCADFVIKVLKEAGITNIGHRLFDTPYRVAGP
jgi:hypothetical protein